MILRSLSSSSLTLRKTKFPVGLDLEERTLISGLLMRIAHPLEELDPDDQKDWGQSLLHWSLGVQWVSCRSIISHVEDLQKLKSLWRFFFFGGGGHASRCG